MNVEIFWCGSVQITRRISERRRREMEIGRIPLLLIVTTTFQCVKMQLGSPEDEALLLRRCVSFLGLLKQKLIH